MPYPRARFVAATKVIKSALPNRAKIECCISCLPNQKALVPVLPLLGRVHLSRGNYAEFHTPRTT